MSEEGKPTNDPCTSCGKPVDAHTPLEASKCRANRPSSLIPEPTAQPKPTVEATPEPEEKPIAEQDNTKPELKPE